MNAVVNLCGVVLVVTAVTSALAFVVQPPFNSYRRVSSSHHGVATKSTLHMGVAVAAATGPEVIESSRFLTWDIASKIKDAHGTPIFVYDESTLRSQAEKALAFPNAYGLTVRYAMKACPNAAILRLFNSMGIYFDASSGYEVTRAMKAGVPAEHICLSSQELPHNFKELIELGIDFNACSLSQLETFGKLFQGKSCGLRFNPGKGSGGTGKTNVGGPSSSFGIWHELKDQAKEIAARYGLKVERIHTHIGSGSDPIVWQSVTGLTLALAEAFPDVGTVDLGGGYKVGRMSYEVSTDLQVVGLPVKQEFVDFASRTGRKLKLEIEPGTFLVANAGALLCTVQDIVSTSEHTFLKLDSGMTEVLRPSLYGAQHPIVVLKPTAGAGTEAGEGRYVIVGHCCESGDLFSCGPGEPEVLKERLLKVPQQGDLVTIEGAGAYCSGMSTKNYNSFPEAPEAIVSVKGDVHLIRRRQTLDQIVANEIPANL